MTSNISTYYKKTLLNANKNKTNNSGKKTPIIIQNNTEYPKIYPAVTSQNTIQKQKSRTLRKVDTVDNSLANNKIQSLVGSTPFINTPNKMYTNPSTNRMTGAQVKKYTFLKGNPKMEYSNPGSALYKRSITKGKGTNM